VPATGNSIGAPRQLSNKSNHTRVPARKGAGIRN
jgi:hypothetical protein